VSNDKRAKKRKFPEIPSVRATPAETKATQDTVKRMLGRLPLERETIPVNIAPPKVTSLPEAPVLAPQFTSPADSTSPVNIATPQDAPLDLMSSLPDVEGYTKLWHQMTDHLYRQLTTTEQAVHIQLFRLSWGFGNATCLIGLPGLAKRIGASEKTAASAVNGLVAKGLVRKVRTVFGKDRVQGIEYEVKPPSSMVKSTRLVKSASLVNSTTNKDQRNKEIDKGELATPGAENCPDCRGTGWHYPHGTEKGVAKCRHERLKAEG